MILVKIDGERVNLRQWNPLTNDMGPVMELMPWDVIELRDKLANYRTAEESEYEAALCDFPKSESIRRAADPRTRIFLRGMMCELMRGRERAEQAKEATT